MPVPLAAPLHAASPVLDPIALPLQRVALPLQPLAVALDPAALQLHTTSFRDVPVALEHLALALQALTLPFELHAVAFDAVPAALEPIAVPLQLFTAALEPAVMVMAGGTDADEGLLGGERGRRADENHEAEGLSEAAHVLLLRRGRGEVVDSGRDGPAKASSVLRHQRRRGAAPVKAPPLRTTRPSPIGSAQPR